MCVCLCAVGRMLSCKIKPMIRPFRLVCRAHQIVEDANGTEFSVTSSWQLI